MSNHTPGPWHIEYPLLDNTSHCAKSGCQMSIQASTGPDVCWIKLYNEWEEYAKANARLIAAAPDMLEALKRCVEFFDCDCSEEYCEECGPHIQARAAIAKATGQEEAK